MKRAFLMALGALSSTTASAGFDDVMKAACSKDNPWRLPAMENAEAPIALNNPSRMITICNCTETTPDADPGVYVLTLPPTPPPSKGPTSHAPAARGKAKPLDFNPGPGQTIDYLPGWSCTAAGPGSVVLHTADHRGVKWGTWHFADPPK